MKNRKIILTIISVLITLSSCVVFILPTWYFSHTIVTNDSSSLLTHKYINLLDYKIINEVEVFYNSFYIKLPTIYNLIFLIGISLTLVSSLINIIISIISLRKTLNTKITKTIPIISIILATITLTISLIFSHESTQTINNDVLSINITIGIYLFTIFQVSGNACSYITHNLKEIQ